MGIYLFCVIMIYMVSSINWMIAINFLIGAITTVRISVCYVYLCEFVPLKYHAIVGTLWNFIDVGIYLTITLYFDFVSHYWMPITLIGLA